MVNPKFTILLPTKNRLDLLKNAIYSVMQQNYNNWEIIIADNCSDEDIEGYIIELNESRIIYKRSEIPLAVTANWNSSIELATGDYIVMLGDDDALLPNYFNRCLSIINNFDGPDFITYGAFIYAYPNVLPNLPRGCLWDNTNNQSYLSNIDKPQLLVKEQAEYVVKSSLKLRFVSAFNMQYFLFKNSFLNRLRDYGDIYQGPFPDYYTANMAMLLGEKIVLVPAPLVVIGISPKSYGYYYFNNIESYGTTFLNNDRYRLNAPEYVRDKLLPISDMDTAALATFALIPLKFPERNDLELDIDYYREKQISDFFNSSPNISSIIEFIKSVYPILIKNEKKAVKYKLFKAIVKSLLGYKKKNRLFLRGDNTGYYYETIVDVFNASREGSLRHS